MDATIDNVLNATYLDSQQLLSQGAPYAALLRLADIHGSLSALDPASRRLWGKRIAGLKLSGDTLEIVQDKARKQARRVERILSIGTDWNEDELLLVLTIRVQLELLDHFLKENANTNLDITFQTLDAKIAQVIELPRRKHIFKMLARQAKKNWGLPIESVVLKEFAV